MYAVYWVFAFTAPTVYIQYIQEKLFPSNLLILYTQENHNYKVKDNKVNSFLDDTLH